LLGNYPLYKFKKTINHIQVAISTDLWQDAIKTYIFAPPPCGIIRKTAQSKLLGWRREITLAI
jgi:hypothetical protein